MSDGAPEPSRIIPSIPHCLATTKAGNPCPTPRHHTSDYCIAHDPAVTPEMRYQWRHAKGDKLLARSPRTSKYYTREEILQILTRRLALWLERHKEEQTVESETMVCKFAIAYSKVASIEVDEGILIRGWRMKGTG